MKKHNEGYALPFVLVVITVLTLVALAISSVSLRNMQSQQASIQRMQDKYAAQGLIEIVAAQLFEQEPFCVFQMGVEQDDTEYTIVSAEELAHSNKTAVPGVALQLPDGVTADCLVTKLEGGAYTADITITAESSNDTNKTQIICKLSVTDTDVTEDKSWPGINGKVVTTYTFHTPDFFYSAYDISVTEAAGGDEDAA